MVPTAGIGHGYPDASGFLDPVSRPVAGPTFDSFSETLTFAETINVSAKLNGTDGRNRTCDALLRTEALYPLSYVGKYHLLSGF